ncbi:MAG: hypothetical protein JXB26_08550 [Candidatus Aminicenantes bacterium]|nr:hypothetical protein [Candidatus Aminicenantes bacterium]
MIESTKKNILFQALIVLSLLQLCHCVPRQKILERQKIENLNIRQDAADKAFQKGHYAALKEAEAIYAFLLSEYSGNTAIPVDLFKTRLLLALRSKELGIPGTGFEKKAAELLENALVPKEMDSYLKIVLLANTSLPGITGERSGKGDNSLEKYFEWARDNADRISEELENKAGEPFFAYLHLTLYENFLYWVKKKPDFKAYKEQFADRPILRYILALVPQIDPAGLEDLLKSEPDFHEALFFLGQYALASGKLFTADSLLKKSLNTFPGSISCLMSLAKISFALEEYSSALTLYEKVLSALPSYRDALLGQAITQSYLGKHENALTTCRTIQELGMYYMGESFYWTAWNYQQMGLLEQASVSIENAKKYLYGNYEVLLLSGIIDFGLNKMKSAEKNFKDVLQISALDVEANFHLGKIAALNNDWASSGESFLIAAKGGKNTEDALKKRIKDIQESAFSGERKERMIRKKELQLRSTKIKTATAFYNAAAGFYNAGQLKKSLECAVESSHHPRFKETAEKLIQKIKKLSSRSVLARKPSLLAF